jgi:tetratricopeptide (TPR) repeat protein
MTAADRQTFGSLLRRYRKQAGLTQEELAERAGLSVRSIGGLERDIGQAPYRATVTQLIEALELAANEAAALEAAAPRRHGAERARPASSPKRGACAEQQLPLGGYLGSLPTGPLAGRLEELARLTVLAGEVAAGTGHLVMLVGEPGIGKTRLAQELTSHLYELGFLIGAGRCYEPEQNVPYYPFLDILSAMYSLAPAEIRADAAQHWSSLGVLLPDQPGMRGTGGPGQAEQVRLFRAVSGFLEALAARSPVAVMLDDLHWADSASLRLLTYLARHTRTARILLLGTYRDVEISRDHPLGAAVLDLGREGLIECTALLRLDEPDTGALIGDILESERVAAGVVHLVQERTEGNPFFVHQVVRGLVEGGGVYRRDGRWECKATEELSVPESVRGVIGRRVARLDPTTQEILRRASVLGTRFNFDELAPLSGHTDEVVERAIDEASAVRLVRHEGKDTYAFDHALTQATLYADLSARQKRRLHLAAGEVLERLPDRSRRERTAELAWHFLQGSDVARAYRYTMLACDEVARLGAEVEAKQYADTAVRLAQELGDEEAEVTALMHVAGIVATMTRYEEALQIAQTALARIDTKKHPHIHARWLMDAGRLSMSLGDLRAARAHIERGMRVAERAGGMIWPMHRFGLLLFYLGEWKDAREQLERLLRADGLDQDIAGAAHTELGRLALAEGRWDDVPYHLAQAESNAESAGNMHQVVLVRCLRARWDALNERVDTALGAIDTLCDDPRMLTEDLQEVRPIQVEIHLAAGDITGAAEIAAQAVHDTRASRYTLYLVEALISQGMVRIREGRPTDATASLVEALALARSMPNLYAEGRALYQLGVLAQGKKEYGTARERFSQALAIFQRLGARKDVELSGAALLV